MRFFWIIIAFVAVLFALMLSTLPSQREQHLLLAPNQSATSIALTADHELVRLLGAKDSVRVTLQAPSGKRFKANELEHYTFSTQPGQRHNWRFELLDAKSQKDDGAIVFRMRTVFAPSAGLRSNEMPVRQGKHNTHVHSYYFFQAADAQSSMQINLGEYINPGISYFYAIGRAPSFDVVLTAPVGEYFAWPPNGANFEDNMLGVRAPANARKVFQYRVAAGTNAQVASYWFVDGNGLLYSRSVGVQYARVQ